MKKVGIIAPSGSIEILCEKEIFSFFEKHNLDVKIFKSCYEKYRYMAGEDKIRLDDIHSAFDDKTIDAIICARGGYGAIRLLDDIDYSLISKNKKPFIGYSDITALLISFYKKSNLCGFHSKMLIDGIIKMNDNEFKAYKKSIEKPFYKSNLKGGILWGGNLATIVSLFGSDKKSYIPNKDIILFVEDINEQDYKIDKMFTQILRNEPLRQKIKGVIFGEFIGCGKYFDEIKNEFVSKLNVQYETNLNITHGENNFTVPFGYKL